MKQVFSIFILVGTIILACGTRSSDIDKLTPDSQTWQIAEQVSEKIPALNPETNQVLAQSDSFVITTGGLFNELQRTMGPQLNQLPSFSKSQLKDYISQNLDELIHIKLLLAAAKEEHAQPSDAKIDSILQNLFQIDSENPKIKEILKQQGMDLETIKQDIRESFLIDKYLKSTVYKDIFVEEEEIVDYYHNVDKKASVRHILLSTKDKTEEEEKAILKQMKEIRRRALEGEEFAALAREYSDDPGSNESGGLIENFYRGQMVKEFEEATFNTPVGEISEIFETRYGYHIVKVINRIKADRPLSVLHDEIQNKLMEEKKSRAFKDHIQKLEKEYHFKRFFE
jgi:parvulin-like peptidyl-prolyl isomerase